MLPVRSSCLSGRIPVQLDFCRGGHPEGRWHSKPAVSRWTHTLPSAVTCSGLVENHRLFHASLPLARIATVRVDIWSAGEAQSRWKKVRLWAVCGRIGKNVSLPPLCPFFPPSRYLSLSLFLWSSSEDFDRLLLLLWGSHAWRLTGN